MVARKNLDNIDINKMSESEIRTELRAALDNVRRHSLADSFVFACRVATTTKNIATLRLAEEIINQIWIHQLQPFSYSRFERVVYNLFWPRIKSIRNIKIHAAEPGDDEIFWDSLSWIRSIRNIKKYNRDLYLYFESIARLDNEQLRTLPREIKGRALDLKNQKATPAERLKHTLASEQIQDAMAELAYMINSTEEARLLMNAILQKDGNIELDDGVICINQLLRVNRNKRVRKYVLHRICSERFFFSERDVSDFFMSASIGITSDAEFAILKELSVDLSRHNPNIKATLMLARNNLAAEKFQRETIRHSEKLRKAIHSYSYEYRAIYDIDRFSKMDKIYYNVAIRELSTGKKQGHYMWYLFPQLKGLGQSAKSEKYGIEDLAEAKEYFKNPKLRSHLLELSHILLESKTKDIREILPNPDDLKLQSCMTLFSIVAPRQKVFKKVLRKYFDGKADPATVYLLSKEC